MHEHTRSVRVGHLPCALLYNCNTRVMTTAKKSRCPHYFLGMRTCQVSTKLLKSVSL
jgi:hypothetical protein